MIHKNAVELLEAYDLARDEWLAATKHWKELPLQIEAKKYTSEIILSSLEKARDLVHEKKDAMEKKRSEIVTFLTVEVVTN